MSKYNPTVTVCSECLRACCWQGEFMCDEYYDANVVKRKISTLIKLNEEHPDYWNNELNSGNKQLLTTEDLVALGAVGDMLELSEKPGTV